MLKAVRPVLIIAVSIVVLLGCGLASAERGGGHSGYSHDGDRHGGYYEGGHYGHYDHDHSDVDVVISGSWGWDPWWGYGRPYYYSYYPYYPYTPYYSYYPNYPYYYAPYTVVPETPPSYIEREEPESAPSSSKWPTDWFYCPGSGSYYPYVKDCPDGWKTVPSTPPADSGQIGPSNSSTPSAVWYYCPDSKTYYPYARKCPGGWQAVPAKPSARTER